MRWRGSLPSNRFTGLTRSITDYLIRNNSSEVRSRKRRMDKKKTKIYLDKLLARREGLVGVVQAAEAYSRERDAEATQDPADMAANAYTKELLVSMSTNDRQLLEMIDEALIRIEAGSYGDCVHCGEQVLEKRLDAVPWARHCLRCHDLHERGLLNVDDD